MSSVMLHHLWLHLLTALRPVLLVICASATGFYLYAVYAARDFLLRRPQCLDRETQPPISILKPLRGLDRDALANFASFCLLDYEKWEILFGAEDETEPSLEAARQAARDHPEVDIRILVGKVAAGANPKVRMLAKLAREAKYSLLLTSDSDIRAGRSHLKRMVQPLRDPEVGVVTCLYRTEAVGLIGKLDALSLSTEFLPGALVARRLEGMSFAMGAGILIRREVLDEIGGFLALEDYLADDYLLGKLPAKAGHRVELAHDVVDHHLGTRNLRDLRARQNRWNLGIRTSRPWSYAGLVFTQGTAAALLFLLATRGSPLGWFAAGATLAVRLGVAWLLAARCLKDRTIGRFLWLVPIRDLLGTALWLAAFFGSTVEWRGRRFRIGSDGRILDPAS
ncbi:MAG TPA: bacteriohopanetetrol glucosamine biosynthesis glycosyltransferase HpnI [Thermoanaerobaculia bacterium]|nr:bacteriohopanetetrol glucosamine biosynthesis glycosyltransferase HpnI [Thermoanaerobaculia bacterium]